MSARTTAQERWSDPDAEPSLVELLAEAKGPVLTEGILASIASELCDIFEVEGGPLMTRLDALREHGLALQRKRERKRRDLSDSAVELLDSLSGCALSVRQLAEDLGRTTGAVQLQLQNLRAEGLVDRSLAGAVYVYRITPRGRRELRAGRRA